ncbi:FAD binding domain-containing protein [Roseibium sp. AS2]|uniref:FAD binding domain-containing protein n=1 Tax=Roseibium sp. AS2 TaxID=3135781 RepID=UPI00317BCEC1
MLSVETYQTITEAAGALGDRSQYIAGGTLVMRAVTYGDQSFDRIVRVRQTDRNIGNDAAGLRIGAGATMSDILASGDAEVLHPVARLVGGPALRNMATIGGNLFAPNPYGDITVALLALDAQVVMANGQSLPVESFLSGRDQLRGLVAAVTVPRIEPGSFLFSKVSRVKPKGVSVMSIAVSSRRGDPRVVFGNMGPLPTRARAAERALAQGSDANAIAAACAVCTEGLAPVDDALASSWYRREVAPVHLRRLLQNGGRV